ncbi:hypothetical protein H312_02272, partial [Anncaliia algerae PRA339]
ATWRNPIRFIEKTDGSVWLVNNLMALNGIVEKDPYELANIREVLNSTQGSKYFTVIDSRKNFIVLRFVRRISKRQLLSLMEKYMNGTAW